MKLKRLGNTSEHKSFLALDKVLRETGFHICRELPINKVIEVDASKLSKQERETLRHASFDFVVYNEDSYPEFAVEFDGPWHEQDEKKRASDIRENSLCAKADLRLLRIDDSLLTEYEKTSLFELVIRRFVDWQKDQAQISEEESDIANYLAATGATEEDYEQMQDPQIMWDLMHPFPASLEIAEELYKKFRVVSSHVDAAVYEAATSQPAFLIFERCNMGSHPRGLYLYSIERSYELRRMSREAAGKYHSQRIHLLSVGASYRFTLPHVDLSNADPTKPLFIFEAAHGQDLPGTSMSELADHFCDFLALEKLRAWADKNLNNSSH